MGENCAKEGENCVKERVKCTFDGNSIHANTFLPRKGSSLITLVSLGMSS